MTPKEKAIQLVDKYRTYVVMWTGGIETENANVKQCALLVVDEIIKEFEYNSTKDHKNGYWQQVKQEINNL